ncbi:hypothetical protein DFH08DRAFT_825966 [Mycena albidolilacea]|uniref:Uncharacterized protein n=1 Tax=Mycena albidolilacea TaxID=1033008 RepID=A0AAD6Z1A8_9AGAR|nr:hypothetical protein DFH08DRAFT_825966 [Mycena albidolilacea]
MRHSISMRQSFALQHQFRRMQRQPLSQSAKEKWAGNEHRGVEVESTSRRVWERWPGLFVFAPCVNQRVRTTKSVEKNTSALETVGLPRYSTTYAISQLCYNLSLGAAVTYLFLWHWPELRSAFGRLRFVKRGHAEVDDPHYKVFSDIISVFLGISEVLVPNGCLRLMHRSPISHRYDWVPQFNISIKYAIQIMAAFIHPGNLSVYRLCTELTSSVQGNPCNSTSFQMLYLLLTDLKLSQYTKLPPRITFGTQMAGSIVGAIFNYTMMKTIVSNNRAILVDPIGSRLWSGCIVQQYNSGIITFSTDYHSFNLLGVLGPFHAAAFLSCVEIFRSEIQARKNRRPKWFAKYNYILSAALDGGSQVILFILSFAVFGASGKAIKFPSWWGNYYKIVGLVGQDREDTDPSSSKRTPPKRNAGLSQVIDDRRAPQDT